MPDLMLSEAELKELLRIISNQTKTVSEGIAEFKEKLASCEFLACKTIAMFFASNVFKK